MGWIIEGIVKVLLSILDYMMVWTSALVTELKLDIGTSGNEGILEFVDPASAGENGLLGKTFPGAGSYGYLFAILAMLIVFIIMIFKLYQGFIAPFTDAEPPGGVVVRAVIASIGVMSSFTIFVAFEKIFNNVFTIFKEKFDQTVKDADFSQFKDVETAIKDGTIKGTTSKAQDAGLGHASSWSHVNKFWGSDDLIDPNSKGNLSGGTGEGNGLGLMVLELMIGFAILAAFIKLVAEIYQRYVTLGLLFYTCPLAFAMIAAKSTKNIWANWIQMLLSQFILMCMNLFFTGVFISAFMQVLNADNGNGYKFNTDVEFITTMLLLLGWLIVGQRADEYMRSLGLSIANTGAGLGGALAAGAMGAYKTLKFGAGAVAGAGGALAGAALHQAGYGSIGEAWDAMKTSAEDKAKEKLSEAGFGEMSGDEFMDAFKTSGTELNPDINPADIDPAKSAEMSGYGAQMLADADGNVLQTSVLPGSEAEAALNAQAIPYMERADGTLQPLSDSEYKTQVEGVKAMAAQGRLPSIDGTGIDNNKYDTYKDGVFTSSKDPSLERSFNIDGHLKIKNGGKGGRGYTPDTLRTIIDDRVSSKER